MVGGTKAVIKGFLNTVFNINWCFKVLVKTEIIPALNGAHSHNQVGSLYGLMLNEYPLNGRGRREGRHFVMKWVGASIKMGS